MRTRDGNGPARTGGIDPDVGADRGSTQAKSPAPDVKKLKRYFEKVQPRQIPFLRCGEYRPGTVIMAKGSTSDYAAIHLQGVVRVRHAELKQQASGPGCWKVASIARLETSCSTRTDPEKPRRSSGPFDRHWRRSLFLRYPGVILWLIEESPGAAASSPGAEARRRTDSRNMSLVSSRANWDRSIVASDGSVAPRLAAKKSGAMEEDADTDLVGDSAEFADEEEAHDSR